MSLFLLLAAVCCLVYSVVLAFYIGFTSMTALTWLVLGAVSGFCSFLWKGLKERGLLAAAPLWLKVGAVTTVTVFLALFLLVEFLVIRGMYQSPGEQVDNMIVLGAKIQGTSPSQSLQYRLETAAEYAKQHPEATIIVSGGQGTDEEISEAQAMFAYLTGQGISPFRIIREAGSKDTRENLHYSLSYVDYGENVVIVTNGFHMFRAMEIAKKLGRADVKFYGLPAKNDWILLPHSLVREFFAVIKAKWLGTI